MPSAADLLAQYTDTTVPGGPVTGRVVNPFQQDQAEANQGGRNQWTDIQRMDPTQPNYDPQFAASQGAPAAPTKQQTVAATADQKKATLAQTADAKKVDVAQQTGVPSLDQLYSATVARNTGVGNQLLPSQEVADLNNLSPYELTKKYGFDRAHELIDQQMLAQGSVQADTNATRSIPQKAGDFAAGVGLGLTNSVGGLGALAAGAVNARAGTAAASGIKALNDYVQKNLQSDGLNAHRQLNATENALGYQVNQDEYDRTKDTDGSFVAGLRQIGKDATTAVGNAVSDSSILSDGVAQGVGSLLTAGPIGRGIAAGANALVGTAARRALVEGAVAADAGETGASAMLGRAAASPLGSKVLEHIGHEGATMAGIGATEAGGAYQQNTADVMDTSFDDLQKNSPMFNGLVAAALKKFQGQPTPDDIKSIQEDARRTVANRSGLIAAAIQGPVATATGALVAPFEAHPTALRSLRETGQNILKEGVEETIQSGSGQLAQNVATQNTSDDTQQLQQGVGEQAGLGGLYGAASAGAVSGPGAIPTNGTRAALGLGKGAVKVAGAVAAPLADLAAKRGEKVMAQNEANSPVSDQKMAAAATEAAQNMPAAMQTVKADIASSELDDSQKEKVASYADQAAGLVDFHPEDEIQPQTPDVVKQAADGQNTRIGFLQNLAEASKDPKNTPQDKAVALATLRAQINGINDHLSQSPDEFDALPDDHSARTLVDQLNELNSKFSQSPAGATAQNQERADKLATQVSATTLKESDFDSAEGLQKVQAAIAAAQISPHNSNPVSNELVMKMASAGKITLDGQQQAALKSANAILDTQKAYVDQLQKTGLNTGKNLVAQQIAANQGSPEGRESALEHFQAISSKYGRGDFDGARSAMLGFQQFVQSQQNKIGAVNAQIAAHGGDANMNNALHYDAARRDKSGFVQSDKPFGATVQGKGAVNSIRLMQEVAAESHALTGLHNSLATAFPELKVDHLKHVPLDPSLANGTPNEVAKGFRDGTRGKQQAEQTTEAVKDETPASKSSHEPVEEEATKQPVTSGKPKAKDAVKETDQPVEPAVSEKTVVQPADSKEEKVGTTAEQSTPTLAAEREELLQRRVDQPLSKDEETRLREIDREISSGLNEGLVRKLPIAGDMDGKGVSAAYPNLIVPKGGNDFTNGFRFPKEARSKLVGVERPADAVKEAFSSEPAFAKATGKSTKQFTDDVRKAYRYHLGFVPKILDAFQSQLEIMLAKGKNEASLFAGTGQPHTFRNGLLLNLVEETENGPRLNQSLMQSAALAGLQWVLGAQNNSSHFDTDDVARIFGVEPEQVTDTMENHLKTGSLRNEGYSDLARKILTYWGVSANPDMDTRITQGIPEAMAAEVVRTFSDPKTGLKLKDGTPFVKEVTMTVNTVTGEIVPNGTKGKLFKEVPVLQVPSLEKFGAIQKLPDAIERVTATKPELHHYLDGDLPTPPATQMNNPGVKLTDEQSRMVANETDTVHKLDMDTVRFYQALKEGNWMAKIFGPGDIDPKTMNRNDYLSKQGQTLSIVGAEDVFHSTFAEVAAHAEATGKQPEDVEIRFPYGVSKAGRLQMQGPFNPQSSKLMRHAILPTESVLDLTSAEHQRAWWLGVAQGIGTKIHNMPFEMAKADAEARLAGRYAVALDVMRSFVKSGQMEPEEIERLHSSLGSGAAFSTAYALMQHARYLNAQEAGEDLTKFPTKLYIEADGKTNGPVMAMAMFARGSTDSNWVVNMSRGGLLWGGTEDQNAGEQYVKDPTDLYRATSSDLNKRLGGDLGERSSLTPDVKGQLQHVLRTMNGLLGDDVIKYDGGDSVEMNRDIAKNPLTVTMYSSGANGIAAKIVGMLTDKIYQQMSVAAANGWDEHNLFGPDQKEKSQNLWKSLEALRQFTTKYDPVEKSLHLEERSTKDFDTQSKSPVDFTFGTKDLASMRENVRRLFVDPMRQSITDVVGQPVFDAMKMVQNATQVQSIFQEHAFNQAVEKALAERKASGDPTYQDGLSYLSQTKLDEIQKSVRNLSPYIQAPGQTFYMSGKSQVNAQVDSFASALGDSNRVKAMTYAPGNIGVAGPAMINIGMGDGRMIQTYTTMPDAVGKHLAIFDGVHFALDNVMEGSRQVNEAAWQTWMGNPLKAVSQSFQTFLKNIPATEVTFGSDLHKALVTALFGEWNTTPAGLKKNPPGKVIGFLQQLGEDLSSGSDAVDARHRAMNRLNATVDQMAGASSPFRMTGKESISDNPQEVADRLSELTREEQAKIDAKREKNPPTSEALNTEMAQAGAPTPSGARVLDVDHVRDLIASVASTIPREQAVLLNSIRQTLADRGLQVIHGTREQLLAYNRTLGANSIDAANLNDENVQGFALPGRQQVWMVSPTSEALAHELVHVATLQTVSDHYNGVVNRNQGAVDTAIGNLEGLMHQFLGMGDNLDGLPREMQVAYNNAQTAINGHLANMDLDEASRKTQALNEYMAWGLANQQLVKLQQRTEAHPLVKMVQEVVKFIRNLVWGRGDVKAPVSPHGDMFSNLLFNTQVVLASQPTMGEMMRDTTLYMSTPYGTSQRLSDLDDSFDRTVTNYVNVPDLKERADLEFKVQHEANELGSRMADNFATVFPMTLQEKTTFSKVVMGLATEARFDPNVLARMQQLWSQVNRNLTRGMLEDPNELDQNQREYDSQRQYDAITGNIFQDADSSGRSTLLPTFVALALTNDHFRSVLNGMDLEKGERSTAESRADRMLENLGNAALDSLGQRFSGEGKSKTVLAAMDSMGQRFVDIAQERQTAMDLFLRNSGGLVDATNDYVVQGMNALARFITDKAETVDAKFNNRLTQTAAASARLFEAIVNEDKAEHVAEGILKYLNNIKGMKPFTDIMYDMVGRVGSNAQVYDMIKTVRSMVQKMRQQFRTEVPNVIARQFSRTLEDHEWNTMHKAWGKGDIASLAQGMSQDEVLSMTKDAAARKAKIADLEDAIRSQDKKNFPTLQRKMRELADYMMNGNVPSNLLKNATAISRLLGENKVAVQHADVDGFVRNIDMLTSLYALDHLSVKEHQVMGDLVTSQEGGMKFALSYLQGQRAEEAAKGETSERAKLNMYKGYIPSVQQVGSSLIVADDAEHAKLVAKSYVRVADYTGSTAEKNKISRGYYFLKSTGRNVFNQGNLQNVRQTAGGVDLMSGYSMGQNAGRITDVQKLKYAEKMMQSEKGSEALIPVYDQFGELAALERSLDPQLVASKLQFNNQLHQMIGVWRGRQVEEGVAQQYNAALVNKLTDMYDADMKQSASNASRYVNVFSSKEQARDPVLADAVKLITPQMKAQIENHFGKDEFWVRRDMLNDVLGYRSASVGDAWTGNSRWSDDTQQRFQKLAMSVFGNKAYQYMVNAEKTYQNLVSDSKTMIVVKSVVVPITNLLSNSYQLAARGVPIKSIIMGMPKKTAEVQAYVKSELRRIEADAQLRAAQGKGDVVAQRKLQAEIQSISDSHSRLSIWPLIQAGEFSAVSDGQATAEEIELTSGRLHSYVENLVNKLPDGIRTAGRYALITKDTALFQGMQTATEYGDFLAKAILYDDLTRRSGMSKADALARVTEEFVNYDRLPGRFRGYMESMGLMWFYNFKIRSAKVALSMIRNNPVHALMAGLAPTPPFFGSVGLPVADNIFTQFGNGSLGYSIGPGQLLHAPQMNPLVHLLSH